MISVNEELNRAQAVFSANCPRIILCEFVIVLCCLALFVPTLIMLAFLQRVVVLPGGELLFMLGMGLVAAPVMVLFELGFYRVLLDAFRGEEVRVGRMFSVWHDLADGLVHHGLYGVGQLFALMACLIPGAWYYSVFFLGRLFVIDRQLDAVNALRASAQATRDHRWSMFRAGVVRWLLFFAGYLCCGIGLVITIPLAMLLMIAIYDRLEPELKRCPLCESSIPPTRQRCPGCDEWAPLRAESYTRCVHCHGRVGRHVESCPLCGEAAPVPPEKAAGIAKPWQLHVPPGPTPPRWLKALQLLLVAPALAWAEDPSGAGQATVSLVTQLSTLPWWVGLGAFGGVFLIPSLGAFLLARHEAWIRGSCDIDQVGVRLGVTERWRGQEIPWERVRGFRVRSDGVRLALDTRKPLLRLFGPLVRTQDRQTHELVEQLEAMGLRNLDG